MQTTTVNYMNTLRKGVSLKGTARLTAEWNYNRFAGPVAILNTNNVNTDTDEFPIESIVAPNRPQKDGLLKARATSGAKWTAAGKPVVEGYVQNDYDDTDSAAGKRSYVVSAASKFKYWTSPTASSSTLVSGGYTLSSGDLELTYANDIWVNKIVVNFEASAVNPKDITVSYKTTAAGAWTAISGTWQIDANGRLILYRQANASWSATQYLLNPFKIRGIKISVPRLDVGSAYLNVIEASARLESDLTPYITEYSVDNSMSDPSLITPLGVCSSNQATVSLSNIDGRFDSSRATLIGPGNIENLFYGIIDKNIYMKMELGLDVNGTPEYTRQFTMWSDEWQSQSEEEVEVTLKDSSKILQEVKPNATLYQNLSTAGLVWRMCDAAGFNNYAITAAAQNDNHLLDFYWTDPEKSVWEHFQDIAQATQTAIFFDEFDVLQVQPRSAAYDLTKPVSWTFDGEFVPDGPGVGRPTSDTGKLSDIVELSENYDYEANVVNVKYTPTAVSKMQGTVPVMESVWEPEGDVVLRSSRLYQTMSNTATSFRITPTEARLWPYTGVVQVEGEFIRYTAKGYSYRLANGTWASVYIKSEEERVRYDELNPNLAYANYFNGYMWAGAGNRGIWGTANNQTHAVDVAGYLGRYRTTSGPVKTWAGGIVHNKNNGTMNLVTNKTFGKNSWYVVTRGASTDAPPYWYGTRFRFPTSGYGYGAAGIAMTVGTNDSGFFCEVIRTRAVSATDRQKWTHELCFYVRYIDGSIKRIGPNGGRGVPVSIIEGIWYNLDVHFEWQGSTRVVTVALNGGNKITASIPVGLGTGEAIGGRYGFFTRGWTSVEFEYLYSSTYAVNDTFDQEGWFDRVSGGYQSSQFDREWIYSTRTLTKIRNKKPYKYTQKYASRLFDEFGPVVHEVREYDVKFDKETPVIHSNLYISNDSQIICPEYIGNPFGASFVVANTARVNAIANGEDTLTYVGSTVDQKMLIYGRMIVQEEPKTYTVRNDAAVNRRGMVEVDIDSPWIQSQTAANEIGTWITTHWGGGNDEIDITAIGNPVLQLGDLVAINHPDKAMTYAANRYFIVGIQHSFDGGLETTFKLRRAKV